jgi:oligo-1,6-glucosidase
VAEGVSLTHPDTGALDMLFQFEHMDLDSIGGHVNGKWATKPLDLRDLKRTMQRWQDALDGQGWNSLYLSNHDQPRPVSRFGDDSTTHHVTSAKLLGTWLHGFQGTPYVYQGEELGLRNVAFPSIDHYQDIESRHYWHTAVKERGEDPAAVLHSLHVKSRDNARTPMPWDATLPNAGFSTGTPWLAPHPDGYGVNAAQAVADPDSVFHHYRRLIALRHAHPILALGHSRQWLPEHPQLSVVEREWMGEHWLVVCNFSGEALPVLLPPALGTNTAELLLGNRPERWGSADTRHTGSTTIDLSELTCQPWEALLMRLRAA